MMKKKTGLFFGSFNPIHIGHLIIAEYCLEHSDLQEIWFVISPNSPFKAKKDLVSEEHRLCMLQMAIEGDERFAICDVELGMPIPSYTADTLKYLANCQPSRKFVMIMGADNIERLNEWKDYRYIVDNYPIMIYPRQGYETKSHFDQVSILCIEAPLIALSATLIRENIKEGKEVRYMLPKAVCDFIKEQKFYK